MKTTLSRPELDDYLTFIYVKWRSIYRTVQLPWIHSLCFSSINQSLLCTHHRRWDVVCSRLQVTSPTQTDVCVSVGLHGQINKRLPVNRPLHQSFPSSKLTFSSAFTSSPFFLFFSLSCTNFTRLESHYASSEIIMALLTA